MNDNDNEMEVDVLVVGSGAGGLTAAITASNHGAKVLVVEKSEFYGGTSAMSGGGIWIPCNHLMAEHGESDSEEAAIQYLDACIGDEVSKERKRAYVREAPKMLKYLEETSDIKYTATPYADYFPDRPGGKDGYRTLDPLPISASVLGKEFFNLRPPHPQTSFGGFTFTINEAKTVLTRAPGWKGVMFRLMASYWLDIPFRLRTKRHRRLALGNALMARCLKSVLDRNIPIWREAPMRELIVDGAAVKGALVERKGKTMRVKANRAVILAAGGFEHNPQMRAANLPNPTDANWSAANGNNTGDSIVAAEKAGAATSLMDAAWWGPSLRVPGEEKSRIMFTERALPGVYIVNKDGERFLNEAASYDEVGRQLYDAPVPAFVVFDSTARNKYAIGPVYPAAAKPDATWSDALKEVVKKAASLSDLAEQLGVSAEGLAKTTERVNGFAKSGIDEDYNKGENTYDRYYGDPTVKPNPCLGPIVKPPFYGFAVYPGDIGTKGGINTDVNARALDNDDRPIPGLYATGNNASSVMGRTYPGAGSTLGPAMTFGYVAGRHAMGAND